MATKHSGSGTHAQPPGRADEELTTQIEDVTIGTLNKSFLAHSAVGTIEEMEETGKTEVVELAQACKSHYEDVILDFDRADGQIKKKTPIRTIIIEGEVLCHWKKQYEELPRDAIFHKYDFWPDFDVKDPKERREIKEWVQQANSYVEKALKNELGAIEGELSKISQILRGCIRWTETAQSDGTPPFSELELCVETLIRQNRGLWRYTEAISGSIVAKAGVSSAQATENSTKDINRGTIEALAQSCHDDYLKVYKKFQAVFNEIFEAWMASEEKAKSDKGKARARDKPRGEAVSEYMEKSVSHRSVLQQCVLFDVWAMSNGVFEPDDSSPEYRLRQLTLKPGGPLNHQIVDPHIDEQIKQQLRSIETTLAEMSGILTGKHKSDNADFDSTDSDDTSSDDTSSDVTDSDDTDFDDTSSDEPSSDESSSDESSSDESSSDEPSSDDTSSDDTSSDDTDSNDTDSDEGDSDDADPDHAFTEMMPELQRLIDNLADYNKSLDRLSQRFTKTRPAEGGVCTDVESDDHKGLDQRLEVWTRSRSGDGDTPKAFRAS